MQRIQIATSTPLSQGAATAVMVSIEGGSCRLYMGEAPADARAGHLVSGGYQIIIPAGVDVFATAEPGASTVAVVGPFGA